MDRENNNRHRRCGAPVHAMPLINMAKAYMKLANPSHVDEKHAALIRKIAMAMTAILK